MLANERNSCLLKQEPEYTNQDSKMLFNIFSSLELKFT